MGAASITFFILGILFILDSLFALTFTRASKNMIKTIAKYFSKEENIRKVAFYELAIAIILLLIAFYI